MSTRFNAALALLFVAAVVGLLLVGRAYLRQATEVERLTANQAALSDTLVYYVTQSGRRAYQVRELTQTTAELRETNEGLAGTIRDLRLRLRDVKAAQQITTRAQATFVPCTVYVAAHEAEAPRAALVYSDPWFRFELDTAGRASVLMSDTVTVVRHARRRRFLWWTWSRYSGRTTVAARSPYTHISNIQATTIDED